MAKCATKKQTVFILALIIFLMLVPATTLAEGDITITVIATPSNGGTVTGGGVFTTGETVTLTAKPNEGWYFIGFKIKDSFVAGNGYSGINFEQDTNEYSFSVTTDRDYEALFAEIGSSHLILYPSTITFGPGRIEEGYDTDGIRSGISIITHTPFTSCNIYSISITAGAEYFENTSNNDFFLSHPFGGRQVINAKPISGLSAGTYYGELTIVTDCLTQIIPISFTVSPVSVDGDQDDNTNNNQSNDAYINQTITDDSRDSSQKIPTSLPSDSSNTIQIIRDSGISIINIGNDGIPLHGGNMNQYVWSLVNLIICIVGVLLVVYTTIRIAVLKGHRARENENEEIAINKKSQLRISHLPVVLTILSGIVGILLFLLTQDMRKAMVLLDWWTLVQGLLLIVGLVSCSYAFRRNLNN